MRVISGESSSGISPGDYVCMLAFMSSAVQWPTTGLHADDFERSRKAVLCFWPLWADSRREVSVSTGPPVWFCQLPSYRRPAAVAPNADFSCGSLGVEMGYKGIKEVGHIYHTVFIIWTLKMDQALLFFIIWSLNVSKNLHHSFKMCIYGTNYKQTTKVLKCTNVLAVNTTLFFNLSRYFLSEKMNLEITSSPGFPAVYCGGRTKQSSKQSMMEAERFLQPVLHRDPEMQMKFHTVSLSRKLNYPACCWTGGMHY